MKSTKTRILSLLLAACMLLSVMAPAVFAADDEALTYYFRTTNATEGYPGYRYLTNDFSSVFPDNGSDGNTWGVNSSNATSISLVLSSDMLQIKFAGVTEDDYAALKIVVPEGKAGKYQVDFYGPIASKKQAVTADVYIVKGDAYDTSLISGKTPNAIISANKDNTEPQNAGTMYFEAGNYLVIFNNPSTISKNFRLSSLKLTPVQSSEPEVMVAKNTTTEVEYSSIAEALSKAEEGQTVELLNPATATETITVKADTILDLNGQTLTANGSLICFGIVTDKQDGVGKIKIGDEQTFVQKTDDAHLIIGNKTDGYGVYAGSVVCASAKGNKTEGVKFTFGLKDAVNAYDAIKTYGLTVTAGLKVDGQNVNVTPVFEEALVKEWAGQGAGYGIWVKVTGLENVQSSLELTPTIGNLTGAAITYTAQ